MRHFGLKFQSNSSSYGLLIFLICSFLLTSCSSKTSAIEATTPKSSQELVSLICGDVSKSDYVHAYANLLQLAKFLDPANRLQERVRQLIDETKALKDATSRYSAGLKFFCDDFTRYGSLEKIPLTPAANKSETMPTESVLSSNRDKSESVNTSDSKEAEKAKAWTDCLIRKVGPSGFSNDDLIRASRECRNELGYGY